MGGLFDAELGNDIVSPTPDHDDQHDGFFDYMISNPPYQQDASTGSNNTAHNIFHLFYQCGVHTACVITMIFPGGRWMQKSSRGKQAALTIYPTVGKIFWYPNGVEGRENSVFPSVVIHDGVSIVVADLTTSPSDTIMVNNVHMSRPAGNQIVPLGEEYCALIQQLMVKYPSVSRRKHSTNSFGLQSNFVEKNPSLATPASGVLPDTHVLSMMANSAPGSAKRVEPHYLHRDAIQWTPERVKLFTEYKVCMTQADASKMRYNTKYFVVGRDTTVGSTWLIVGSFPTEMEARNYAAYLGCDITRKLLLESRGGKTSTWGAFVPDLGDYTNNNPHINWDAPLDTQIEILFGITES